MPHDVVIPKLGMTMKDGTVAEWVAADGSEVHVGQVLYIVETEKLTADVEALDAGILRHAVPAGTKQPVGETVGWILDPGEAAPEPPMPNNGDVAPERVSAANGGRVKASPVARRLADQQGVDLATVVGSGPGGRIEKADVEAVLASAAPAVASVAEGEAPDVETVPVRGARRVIAERMHASLQTMAQLTLTMDVDMTRAVVLRDELVAAWAADGVRPTYTDLVAKATAEALAEHPRLNAAFRGDTIDVFRHVHLGVAVALDDGLIVPVVRDARGLMLRDLARRTNELAQAARSGTLGPDDVDGATCTITSLGSAGVRSFTPIVNPPNVAILGVGAIADVVALDQGMSVVRQRLTLSLTVDHRAIDGAPAAAFLGTVRDLLEAPYRLLA